MESASLSLVIAAKNCAKRLEGTIRPWLGIANEVIVVDQFSTDDTPKVALDLGCVLIQSEPPNGNFNLNRRMGMERAKSDWIFYLDTDERPTPELLTEMREFLKRPLDGTEPHGVKIANLFYFLGKPLMHGIYNPRSAEIRLMRKGKWSYPTEASVHIGVSVAGPVHRFTHPYRHFNVNTLSEWFIKTNHYTELDAIHKATHVNNPKIRTYSLFWNATKFFCRHYFVKRGFLDGFRGLVSIFYFMLYHLTQDIKLWEKLELAKLEEEKDFLEPIEINTR